MVDVLVTLLAKQGAVVLAMKSAMEIFGADSSLLCLAVYLHGSGQLIPDHLEYPLSDLFRKLNFGGTLKLSP